MGSKIVDHSDVAGASPIFILDLTPGFNGLGKLRQQQDETGKQVSLGFGAAYIRDLTISAFWQKLLWFGYASDNNNPSASDAVMNNIIKYIKRNYARWLKNFYKTMQCKHFMKHL